MNILDLIEEVGLVPKRKASTNGGEYCSPCPFCKDGDDRFLIWPQRHNKNGDYHGGRFTCRVCGRYGDAITFLLEYHDMDYREACALLKIEPKKRTGAAVARIVPQLRVADDPPALWKDKARYFIEWAHMQLLRHPEGLSLLRDRGFTDESIARFTLGYNPETLFRERTDWGLPEELKDDGKPRKIWLPAGLVIPTFAADRVIKVKIRRSEWKEGDEWPKYVEVSGSMQKPSIFGDPSLPCLVLESELDALLVQQEADDLVCCVALGGSTKPLDADTDGLIKNSPQALFLPDIDEAGAVAWLKWEQKYPGIHCVVIPKEKSAGDYFSKGGNLREWIIEELENIKQK